MEVEVVVRGTIVWKSDPVSAIVEVDRGRWFELAKIMFRYDTWSGS